MNKLRLFFKLAPMRIRDAAFELACAVLLPLSTMCKVCNMLRGMAIGMLLGGGAAGIAIVACIRHGWVC